MLCPQRKPCIFYVFTHRWNSQVTSNGKTHRKRKGLIPYEYVITEEFQFPSNGKTETKRCGKPLRLEIQAPSFHSLQTGKRIRISRQSSAISSQQREVSLIKNLLLLRAESRRPLLNSLQTGKYIQRDPILSPVGPWLRNAKTKREVHKAFFMSNFSPKIPQTHVGLDPNTIF